MTIREQVVLIGMRWRRALNTLFFRGWIRARLGRITICGDMAGQTGVGNGGANGSARVWNGAIKARFQGVKGVKMGALWGRFILWTLRAITMELNVITALMKWRRAGNGS